MEKPFMYTITCKQPAANNQDEKFMMSAPCTNYINKSKLIKMVNQLAKKTTGDGNLFRIYVFIENYINGKRVEYSKMQHEFLQ